MPDTTPPRDPLSVLASEVGQRCATLHVLAAKLHRLGHPAEGDWASLLGLGISTAVEDYIETAVCGSIPPTDGGVS